MWYLMTKIADCRLRIADYAREASVCQSPIPNPQSAIPSRRLQYRHSCHMCGLREEIERPYVLDDVIDVEPLQIARERGRITRDVDEFRDGLAGQSERDIPMQPRARRVDHDGVRHRQARQYVLRSCCDEARRRKPVATPRHRLLVDIHTDDACAAL